MWWIRNTKEDITKKEMTENMLRRRKLMEKVIDMVEETGRLSLDGKRSKAGVREGKKF